MARARIDALKQKTALAPSASPALRAGATKAFDGNWDVVVVCASDRNALGYNLSMAATVKDGVLHGERLTAGTLGWMVLDGTIAADGGATLNARGQRADLY